LNCSNKTGWTSDVLTLNKIQPQRFSPTIALRYDGFIDYAINLIESDRYRDVFATFSAAQSF